MNVDLVVVGAGLAGSVIAERAARELDWRVLVVEQRSHIGGNTYDHLDAHGVRVHEYGPHVFHTNSERVWTYLSQFTAWRRYQHRVCALVDQRLIPLPVNLASLERLFSPARAARYRDALVREYGLGATVPILRLRLSAEYHNRWLAEVLYERVFLGYTTKHWGRRPEELDGSVTGRVPVRISYDDRYFADRFQGLPRQGYTAMVSRMLAHPNIEVRRRTDFHDVAGELGYRCLVYTGPIDRFFVHRYGPLPYRSVRFVLRHDGRDRVQDVGAVTYPNQHAYTRTCEYKVLTGQEAPGTTISYEYPQPHQPGTVPYYPLPCPEGRARYAQYARLAQAFPDVVFLGRLGSYQYLNMDQVVAQALKAFRDLQARYGARWQGLGPLPKLSWRSMPR